MKEVERILASIPESISKRAAQKKELQRLFEQKRNKLVIYGHGNLGRQLRTSLEAAGWQIQFFIDAKQNTDLEKGIISLTEADKYVALDSPIIVAIYDLLRAFPSIREALLERGFSNILKITDLRVWPDLFQGGHIHDTLSWDISDIEKRPVLEAYSLMSDDMSRKTFAELLRFMIVDPDTELTLCPGQDQYMPSDVYIPSPKEMIIDCGAFDGDTMRAFSRAEGFQSYLCVEPDPSNITRLKRSIQEDLPEELRNRVKYINCAVSNEEGSISFASNGSSNSFIDEEKRRRSGGIEVAVRKLENIVDKSDIPLGGGYLLLKWT